MVRCCEQGTEPSRSVKVWLRDCELLKKKSLPHNYRFLSIPAFSTAASQDSSVTLVTRVGAARLYLAPT